MTHQVKYVTRTKLMALKIKQNSKYNFSVYWNALQSRHFFLHNFYSRKKIYWRMTFFKFENVNALTIYSKIFWTLDFTIVFFQQ